MIPTSLPLIFRHDFDPAAETWRAWWARFPIRRIGVRSFGIRIASLLVLSRAAKTKPVRLCWKTEANPWNVVIP